MPERDVPEILAARRRSGADCTEDESAALKDYVRNAAPGDKVAKEIADLFPVEYDEATEEDPDACIRMEQFVYPDSDAE